MNLERIMDFFYEKASNRIGNRIKESKLKYYEIYKPDTKQISRIVNNKRTKNNPYLICDAVFSSSYIDDETGRPINCGLLSTKGLRFSNKQEILWGTGDEIDSYLYDLFELLFTETASNIDTYGIDEDKYLCNYIPYAKYSSYWKILFSKDNHYPAIFYGIYEDTVIENIDSARDEAMHFLYSKCNEQFKKSFYEFVENTDSFHKIDKVFKASFIHSSFVPMIKANEPGISSIGLRVRDLIFSDLSHCASLVAKESIENVNYIPNLIHATAEYILALEDIQKQYK